MGIHFLDRSPFMSGDGENIFINQQGLGSGQEFLPSQKKAKFPYSSTVRPTHARLRSEGDEYLQNMMQSKPGHDLSNVGKSLRKFPETIKEESRI